MRVLTLFAVLAAGAAGAVVTGSDDAKGEPRAVAPEPETTRDELRQIADHYRKLTQTYERVARRPATPSTATYRRASSRRYLQWTIDLWQARAVHARGAALATVQRRAHVELPQAPPTRAPIVQRIAYHRDVAWRLQRALPQRTTPSTDSFRTTQSADYRRWTLHLWQERAAEAALAVSQKAPAPAVQVATSPLASAFMCIHRYEGAWDSNTGNGYYGGLQMDWSFMRAYGGDFLARWGTADAWPAWAQIEAATRAHRSGRGFSPWPNTARACGLL
jgi:hypothetical protein